MGMLLSGARVSKNVRLRDTPVSTDVTHLRLVKYAPEATGEIVITHAPKTKQFVPRDIDTNLGTVTISGTASGSWTHVLLLVVREGVLDDVVQASIGGGVFSANVVFPAELYRRDIFVLAQIGQTYATVGTISDIVAGDVWLIDGQSNAAASRYYESSSAEISPWVRSFGTRSFNAATLLADNAWHYADGDGDPATGGEGPGHIGQLALRCFHELALEKGIPQCVINNAVGGITIQNMNRNPSNPGDVNYHFGKLNNRLARSGLPAGCIRAAIFYQGESNANAAPPYGPAQYKDLFSDRRSWYYIDAGAQLEQFYVLQVHYSPGNVNDAALPEVQRKFEDDFPGLTVLSTNGVNGHNGLHYSYGSGYKVLGGMLKRRLLRDCYGASLTDVEPPRPSAAATIVGDVITIPLKHDATLLKIDGSMVSAFSVSGATRTIQSVVLDGNDLKVTLVAGVGTPTLVSYRGATGTGAWLVNAERVGMLSFALPVAA